MIKCRTLLMIALVLLALSGVAAAITVDGVRSIGEWDENWNFGQVNGTAYDPSGPFGNKMVVFQNGNWYDEDPKDDSGSNFNESMSTIGPHPSGSDIKGIYAHYDIINDTLYGMCTVYGLPGDLDGNGDIATTLAKGDLLGDNTGRPITGIGPQEHWTINLIQGNKYLALTISNNDWNIYTIDLPEIGENNVFAANSNSGGPNCSDCVYEISISNLSQMFDLSPGAGFSVTVNSGGYQDIVGEDIAAIFFQIPNPIIDIEKSTNGEDADNAPGPGIPEGENVTWTYVVTNTGDVPLENISVIDDKLGPITNLIDQGDGDDILSIGESWIFEATGIAECGQYVNNATAVGFFDVIPVFDTDPSHYFGECPDIDIEKATNGEDADEAPGPGILQGATVTWTYVVNNTGNVPLSNISVIDDQGVIPVYQNGDVNDDGILDVDEIWVYETAGIAGCGQYANNATVTGEYGEVIVTDDDPSHYFGECPSIDIEKATNGEDADDPTGPFIPVGASVTWTYNVTNTGNVDLSNVVVTDNLLGEISVIGDLAAGASTEVSANGIAVAGQYANIGNVTGDYNGITVTDEDPSHYFGASPSIDIEKATNGEDADSAPGPSLGIGDAVTWTYVVTNTGNVNLSNIVVTDDKLGVIGNIVDNGDGDGILSVGETWTYQAAGSASCGQYANLGTVTGDYGATTVNDSDPSHYNVVCAPNIDIEKSTNGFDADSAPGPTLAYGAEVTWEYVVRNTGNVHLTNITVTDDQLGTISNIVDKGNGDDTLMPGEVWIYQSTGTAECGQYANVGDVVGYYGAIPVTDSDPSHYRVSCAPDIDIEKYINGNDADQAPGILLAVGDSITWKFVVKNTGNVPLEDVVIVDDKLGTIPASSIISKSINNDDILDPGEVWTYELKGSVTECVPQHKNTAIVTGEFEGTEVSDEDVAHYYCQPVVPLLSPVGMMVLISVLGLAGAFYLRRRD